MSQSLLASRRFAPLFWCQFFSAFNDNFLKNALALLILFKIGGQAAEPLVTLAGGIFIAPFFLMSAFGGELADRFDKALVARRLKLTEIGAAAVAVAGFQLNSMPLLFVALFLFGLIGALFGPIKYGILPDHLRREELPKAANQDPRPGLIQRVFDSFTRSFGRETITLQGCPFATSISRRSVLASSIRLTSLPASSLSRIVLVSVMQDWISITTPIAR